MLVFWKAILLFKVSTCNVSYGFCTFPRWHEALDPFDVKVSENRWQICHPIPRPAHVQGWVPPKSVSLFMTPSSLDWKLALDQRRDSSSAVTGGRHRILKVGGKNKFPSVVSIILVNWVIITYWKEKKVLGTMEEEKPETSREGRSWGEGSRADSKILSRTRTFI